MQTLETWSLSPAQAAAQRLRVCGQKGTAGALPKGALPAPSAGGLQEDALLFYT